MTRWIFAGLFLAVLAACNQAGDAQTSADAEIGTGLPPVAAGPDAQLELEAEPVEAPRPRSAAPEVRR
jgi:hypothetical protein